MGTSGQGFGTSVDIIIASLMDLGDKSLNWHPSHETAHYGILVSSNFRCSKSSLILGTMVSGHILAMFCCCGD